MTEDERFYEVIKAITVLTDVLNRLRINLEAVAARCPICDGVGYTRQYDGSTPPCSTCLGDGRVQRRGE